MRLSSTLSSCILKTSSDGDSTMSLGRLFQWLIALAVKNFFYRDETSSGATCTCCPLSAPCGSLRREGLHPLYSCPLSTAIPWWGPPWAFSSPGRKDLTPSVFPHIAGSPALWSSSWPSFGPSPVCLHFWIVGTRAGHGTPGAARWALSGTLVSPSLLVMSPQMQPRIRFAFVAAAAHCWLVFSLSTRTPRSLSARLLPSHTDPSLYRGLWLWCPSCRTWHLSLLNFIQFLLAHFSRLSRSLFLMCPPHHPVQCDQQTWCGCFQSHRTDHLWRSWTAWDPVLMPGGPHLWQAASLSKNHWSSPSEYGLWASFLPISQTIHPVCILPVWPGEGCGKQHWTRC